MKKLIILLLVITIPVAVWAWGKGVGGKGAGQGTTGGLACSGDMSDGGTEDFEKGDGLFCTTDWTEADTDGVVDTYDTGKAHCGSNSLLIALDDANVASNRAYVDLGSAAADIYVQFYVWIPTIVSNKFARIITIGDDNDEGTSGTIAVQIGNISAQHQLKFAHSVFVGDGYFVLTPGNKYRVGLYIDRGDPSGMKVWDSGGTPVETNSGGGDYEMNTNDSGNVDIRYIIFRDDASAGWGASSNVYFDDVVIDVDAVDFLGAESCS